MIAERPIHILFASETGTAEQEAKMFQLQCRERGYKTILASLDEFPLHSFPEIDYCTFFVSTTGIME